MKRTLVRRVLAGLVLTLGAAGPRALPTVAAAEAAKNTAEAPIEKAPSAEGQPRPQIAVGADDLRWTNGPAALPLGSRIAMLEGNPKREGIFTMRLRLPAGLRIMPHSHPVNERLTVISGTYAVGKGDRFDEKGLLELRAGGFSLMPANTRHFSMAREETVLQITAIGPWEMQYVKAGDDPRNAPAPK